MSRTTYLPTPEEIKSTSSREKSTVLEQGWPGRLSVWGGGAEAQTPVPPAHGRSDILASDERAIIHVIQS